MFHRLVPALLVAAIAAPAEALVPESPQDGSGAESPKPERGEEPPQEKQNERGLQLPRRPGGDLAPGSPGRRPRLQVPRGGRSAEPGTGSSGRDVGGIRDDAEPAPRREPLSPTASSAASFVFEELARTQDPQTSLAREAVESLLAMGEEGLAEARQQLSSDEPATLLTACRVLLRGGSNEDHARVLARMEAKLPSAIAQPLLLELIERDPVLASPEQLVAFLSHATGSMRAAAERELGKQSSPALLRTLAPALDARRADTRLRAVTLVGGIQDPGALPLLADQLGDGSASVASRASELLAARSEDTDEVITLLRARAFAGSVPSDAGREGAYALLSIVHREERSGTSLLTDEDVPRLLQGVASRDPLTSVASAIALAGIGFRSARSSDYTWLDLEVPHALVRWGSGAEFHSDFSAVHEVALRRVGLLSGEPFGLDGPTWRRWWTEQAGRFKARRAVVPVSLLDAPALALVLRSGFRAQDAVAVIGPAAPQDAAAGVGQVVYIDVDRTESLFALLERESVFGAERLPASGSAYREGRVVDVRIGARGKLLEEPRTGGDAWFERIVSSLEAINDENAWQRWFDPLAFSSQREFWEAERERFGSDPTAPERLRAEVELLLARVAAFGRTSVADDREEEIFSALRARYALPGVAQAADFPRLTELLRAERYFGKRSELLLGLAIRAGRLGPADDSSALPSAAATEPALDANLAQDLLDVLVQQEGPGVSDALARVIDEQGVELARRAASSEDGRLRAIAAPALAASTDPEDRALLERLLEDPQADVEASACRAIADAGLEEFAPALLARARMAPPAVRGEALKGLVAFEHPEAFELLRVALYEPEMDLQLDAAEGLAALEDPSAAPVLARLMTRGPNSPLFPAARTGLIALGTAASDDLLILANSGAEDVRREAALILSELGEAEALPLLLARLTLRPDDERVIDELAILSCVDFRGTEDPVASWWGWWDLVVHDDSRAWIAAASEVAGRPAPALSELQGEVSLSGAAFYVGMLADERPNVVERVRRELSRVLGREIVLAESEAERARQRAALEAELRAR